MIDRTTLAVLLSLSIARERLRYSDASGHRAVYGSYCGNWYIEWPLGGAALVRFAQHEPYDATTDVFPRKLHRRVDKCIQLTAGVIASEGSNQIRCAFTGRKSYESNVLQHQRRGFQSVLNSSHLYRMVGGNVSAVDYLHARKLVGDAPSNSLLLTLPSREKVVKVSVYVLPKEQKIVAHTPDYLPWDFLPWSVHRGLRDILVAFAKPSMDRHRQSLAS